MGGRFGIRLRRRLRLVIAMALLTIGMVATSQEPASAYCRSGMSLWHQPAIAKRLVVHPSFPRRTRKPLARSLRQWNRSGSVLRYRTPLYSPDWWHARWMGMLARSPLLQASPGMARRWVHDGRHSGGQIILNADYRWIRGRHDLRRGTADVQTVAVHEVGHFTGLAHPWPPHCADGSAVTTGERRSVMTAVGAGKRRQLRADDVAAVRALY